MLKNYTTGLTSESERRRIFIIIIGAVISFYISISVFYELRQVLYLLGKDHSSRFKKHIRHIINYSSQTFNQYVRAGDPNSTHLQPTPEIITNHIDHGNGQYIEGELTLNQKETGQYADTTHGYKEYEDICTLIVDIWSRYPNNEVQGFITSSGKMIITSVGNTWQVSGPKPILFNGRYYLAWDKRKKLNGTYEEAIDYSSSDHIFIPVKAMFHTHVVSGKLSEEDQLVAKRFNKLRHLLFERAGISEFDGRGIKKIYRGNMINLCELLRS